jgi:hypothetical protein
MVFAVNLPPNNQPGFKLLNKECKNLPAKIRDTT